MWSIYGFLLADWLQGRYTPFIIPVGWKPMSSNNFCQIDSALIPSIASKSHFSPNKSFCASIRQNGFWDEIIKPDVFRYGVDSAHLFNLRSDLWNYCITEGTCIDACFRSKPMSGSGYICLFTFEFQSESSANGLHVSGYFCTTGLVFTKLLNHKMLSNNMFCTQHSVLYKTHAICHEKGSIIT